MAKIQVTAPVRSFTGVVAGVAFGHGVATLDSETHKRALRYFTRRAGYEVVDLDAQEAAESKATKAAERKSKTEADKAKAEADKAKAEADAAAAAAKTGGAS